MLERMPAPEIAGIELGPEIGRGAHTVVRRAQRGEQPVAVKIATFDPDGRTVATTRFRREAGVLASVRHPALPTVLELGESGAHAYLVLEFVDGLPLSHRIAVGKLPEAEAVAIGRVLASALAALHRHGLVHRDVKPENVILDPSGRVRLIDFGLAVENAGPSDGSFAGSLLYSAPEQVGVIRRPVDGRADLYSLGCVLFECLTGRPPFESRTASELLHQQASVPAPSVAGLAEVSAGLAAVVARLLAKDPDDRYQSAHGLLADLDRIATLNALAEAGLGITLGQHDLPIDAPQELDLVGREREIERLRQLWGAALGGRSALAVLEGEAGSGKSRLTRELVRYVRGRGGLVLVAPAVQSGESPLAPIRGAIESWLRQLPEAERGEVGEMVLAAAGGAAPLLRRLSPALAGLLPAGEVTEGDAGEQFLDAVASFVRGLSRFRGGLLLVADDVQWLDDASLDVLRRLAQPTDGAPLLVVATVRIEPNQTDAAAEVRGWDAAKLRLAPLDRDGVAALVGDLLGSDRPDPAVVDEVVPRAGGNPLVVGELVRAMIVAGLLRPHWGAWKLDEAGLQALDLPEDVLELILRRVAALSGPTQDVLAVAAVIGSRFPAGLLGSVVSARAALVEAALAEAGAAGLIQAGRDGCAFVHDRVREALLSRLDDKRRRALHQQIADALRSGASGPAGLFDLARHAAQGEVERDPVAVRATCKAAGLAAILAFADGDAYTLLAQARAIGGQHRLSADVELDARMAEVCARLGLWSDAIDCLREALAQAVEPHVRGRLRTQLAQAHMANRDAQLGWREARAALDDFGVTAPGRGLGSICLSIAQGLLGLLTCWSGLGYGRAPAGQRASLRSLCQLYETAAFLGYLLNDRRLVGQMMLRSLFAASKLGDSRELAVTWIGIGLVLGLLGRPRLAGLATDAGARIAEALGDRLTRARARAGAAWAQHVGGRPRVGAELARFCADEDGRWLDAHAFWAVCADLAWNLALRGYPAEALLWIDRAARRAEATSRQIAGLSPYRAGILAVLGRLGDAREELGRARRVAEQTPEEQWRLADVLAWGALVSLESGDVGAACDEVAAFHSAFDLSPSATSFHARHFFVFDAHIRLTRAARAKEQERGQRLAEARAALARLRSAGRHPTLRAHALVLDAALHRIEGRLDAARRGLNDAEVLAESIDAPWVLFEVARQRAHLARQTGDAPAALRHARAAAGLARDRGWPNRVSWVRAELGADALSSSGSFGGGEILRPMRHLEALQAVALATATVLDPVEQARVALGEVVRVMGAERGFLFRVQDDGGLRLAAGHDPGEAESPEPHGYSRTVVEQVAAERQAVVLSAGAEGPLAAAESVVRHDLRSIVAAPMLVGDRLLGVLYLDNRLARGVFGGDDAVVVSAIAAQIAIASETANAYSRQAALAQENARLLETVREQLAELRLSRGRVAAAEERLRREIAELLHSRVQTRLLVAWHQLGQVLGVIRERPEVAVETVEQVREEIDQIREREIRRASHQLHPAVIRVGLVPALRSLAAQFDEQFAVGLDVDPAVTSLDNPADNRIPEDRRLTAYRAVEEALANVARHSQATAVTIRLGIDDTRLRLAVEDDGIGFDPAERRDGLGLTSIGMRVEAVGGSLELRSAPGAGTTLGLVIPLGEGLASTPLIGAPASS
jgi:signal transduction histidine kinase